MQKIPISLKMLSNIKLKFSNLKKFIPPLELDSHKYLLNHAQITEMI